MLRNVFLKSLWEQRRSLLWWTLGLAALTLVTVLFYPSFSDSPKFNDLLGDEDSLVRAFVGDVSDLTSPEGFLNSQLYFFMVPLLFLVFAIARGSGAIAGEEERGTLDLLLSNPLTRSQVLLHKFAAMLVAILALALILWFSALIGVIAVDMDISFMRMAEATLSAALLGILFGAVALTLGSATGKRGMSIGVASAIGVSAYLLNAFAPIVDALEPLSKLSPFYYYSDSDPLTNGLNLLHAAVLVGLTLLLLPVALFTFERRDLAV